MKLEAREIEAVFSLVEHLTGSSQAGRFRKDIIISNVERRLTELNLKSFADYLKFIKNDGKEYARFLSSITIHTTSWFRETPHFDLIQESLPKLVANAKDRKLQIWSSACSSGEEVYTLALYLSGLPEFVGGPIGAAKNCFDFEIYGTDIDPICIAKAQKGHYEKANSGLIPKEHLPKVYYGIGPNEGLMTIEKALKLKCRFELFNLIDTQWQDKHTKKYDIILCRNVLIYFAPERVNEIVQKLALQLTDGGLLVLGHSEALVEVPSNLRPLGRSSYIRDDKQAEIKLRKAEVLENDQKKSALVIDDSPTLRKVLVQVLKKSNFNAVEAPSAEEATQILLSKKFDLITLDLNLPGENGVQWLKRQRDLGTKTPVVIVSDSTPKESEKVFGALENGAQEYIVKSQLNQDEEMVRKLLMTIGGQNRKDLNLDLPKTRIFELKQFRPEIILVGASTGGPEALGQLLYQFPRPCPPIVVVQHIHPDFSAAFSRRLAQISGLSLGSLEGEELSQNQIYLAQGDYHLEVVRSNKKNVLKKTNPAKVNGHRPSVDTLFHSVALARIPSVAILLTGMGNDGAAGMLELYKTGASFTMAQDQTSVVFGMPRKALEMGAVVLSGDTAALRRALLTLRNGGIPS